jgi:hypothetical protein
MTSFDALHGADSTQAETALDLFGGHMIATVAAEHADFRMMLNARQLAHKYHRHLAMRAHGRWDFADGGGRRHERKIRLSERGTVVTSAIAIPAPELVKIVRLLWPIRTTGLRARENCVNVVNDACSIMRAPTSRFLRILRRSE